jgi:hypothetical protein
MRHDGGMVNEPRWASCASLPTSVAGMIRRPMDAPIWADLVAAIPWLSDVGGACSLDIAECVVPTGVVAAARRCLEQRLDAHVMTYRRIPVPRRPGRLMLCELVMAAHLDPVGLSVLRRVERWFVNEDVVFCAYRRPLVRWHPVRARTGPARSPAAGQERWSPRRNPGNGTTAVGVR